MTTVGRDGSVEFRFFRPTAREVALAGDFNGWRRNLPMRRDANGWWTLRVTLAPGDYRFRYVADGEWYTDFAANGVELVKHGWNSLLHVPATRGDVAASDRDAAEVLQYKQHSEAPLMVA